MADWSQDTDIVATLQARATARPEHTVYVFLGDGEHETAWLSYGELDRRARAAAATLQREFPVGGRALLLYPPGLAYIEAFFACLYAGLIAVPAYPPARHHLERLRSIVQDAAPSLVLTTAVLQAQLAERAALEWRRPDLRWHTTDAIDADAADAWLRLAIEPERLAFLQYTSGSTGDPKGVMVSHRNLIANQEAIRSAFSHTEASTVVGWLPFYHDMGLIGNILQPLYVGATAVLMPSMAFLERPERWLRAISRYRAHTSGGPNFAYELCARAITHEAVADLDLSHWQVAFNGAEPVRAVTLERFATRFATVGFRREALFPCYGLAEATLFVTGPRRGSGPVVQHFDQNRLSAGQVVAATDAGQELVGCGLPWGGQEVAIVDPESRLRCLPARLGEIWVRGPSVAQGYWQRPEPSDEIFDAWTADTQDGPWLRTGDLGFITDGQLFLTGRLQDLIILRGRNYYPQDLEVAIEQAIADLRPGACAAFAVERDGGAELVVVAEVRRHRLRRQGATALFTAMRAAVAAVSDAPLNELLLVLPGALPKTSSGKLRRARCRELYLSGGLRVLARQTADTEEPRMLETSSPTRPNTAQLLHMLRAEIARTLGLQPEEIAPQQALSSFGLDSLRVIELKHVFEQAIGYPVPLAALLTAASLDGLVSELSQAAPSHAAMSMNARESVETRLSFPQRAMWTVHQLDPQSVAYNLHLAVRLEGRLETPALHAACRYLVERHPSLRTVYRTVGEQVQTALCPVTAWPDLFTVVAAETYDTDALQADMTAQVRVPFDLEHGPLLRIRLYRHAPERHSVLFVAHHIAVDLWSLLILWRDLAQDYRWRVEGAEESRPTTVSTATGSAGLISVPRVALHTEAYREDWAYWQEQLSGPLPLLSLPLDYPRPSVPHYCGASVAIQVAPELTARLKTLARSTGVTPFTLLLAAYAVLLYRYTHQTDLIIGVPTSGRLEGSLAEAVGNFVNPLPIRCRLRPQWRFLDLLTEIGRQLQAGLAHQAMPFPLLVERLQPERHADHWPIYQTMCVFQQAPSGFPAEQAQLALGEDGPGWDFAGLRATPLMLQERIEMFDLKVMAAELSSGWQLSFQYRRELFHLGTIQRLAEHFTWLLEGAVAAPTARLSALPRFSPAVREQIVTAWNATATTWADPELVPELIAQQAQRTPERIALVYEGHTLSYAQLNRSANRIAHGLRKRGLGGDDVVAICGQRSLELVPGLLGILKAGAAYLPLASDDPPLRLQAMLTAANVRYALVQPQLQARLSGLPVQCLRLDPQLHDFQAESATEPQVFLHPAQLAYVLFTSGSTGAPKGVGVPHAGLRNRLLWMQAAFTLQPGEPILQKTPYTFDVSVWEFFWPLMVGGQVVLAGPEDHKDAARLMALIAQHQATTVHFVPSMLAAFLESPALVRCGSLRRVICSGEALSDELRSRCQSLLPARLYNLYGPTEAAIDVSAWPCRADETGPVPIGRPIANTTMYLLDAELEPVPVGVPGEIYLGGVQLARGYTGRPTLTAQAFLPDPFGLPGGRLYRTGDLGRYRPDGVIEYLGRQDHQVKLRGLRIELGEIETQLQQSPAVRAAVVVVWSEPPRLVAYVVARPPLVPDRALEEDLCQRLSERLPEYMVPGIFVWLEALPLSANGKLDRQRLPAPILQSTDTHVPPRDQREATLARIWAEVLRLERVGVQDNFFHLGGDSIRAIQVASRAHQSGLEVSPRQVLQHPTIAALAAMASEVTDAAVVDTPAATVPAFALVALPHDQRERVLAAQPALEDLYPLTPMQEGILFHSLMDPGSGMYVMQDQYLIRGKLDVEAFRNAWQGVMDRHPILRTSFVWEGLARPHQRVHRHVGLPFVCHDWRAYSAAEQEARLETLLAAERADGLDVQEPPLLRIHLFRLDEDTWRCVRTYHHILLDEWCTSPLFLEFRQRYTAQVQGNSLALPPVRPFRDYLAWLSTHDPAQTRHFWQSYLAGFVDPTPLVIDHAGARDGQVAVADAVLSLTAPDTQTLQALAQRRQLTLNTLIQAAWALVLSRYSRRHDVLFGMTVAGRPPALAGIEATLGLFINTLPLRVRIRPETRLAEWLHELLASNLELRQYEHTPLVQVQEWSEVPRGQDLFQHLLVYENAPIDPSLLHDHSVLDMRFVSSRVHTNYPLTVTVIPGTQLVLKLTYQESRFTTTAIAAMLRHFRALLLAIGAQPEARVGELRMLEAEERSQVLHTWNQTEQAYPEPAEFVAAFAQQVAVRPTAVAARCGEARLSYHELHTAANRLAQRLRTCGVGTDTLVALLDERGLDLLVMIVGVLKAGAAYLPLDPRHPPARWAEVLRGSRAPLALCGAAWQAALVAALSEHAGGPTRVLPYSAVLTDAGEHTPALPIVPQQLAYVMYTSGSTGTPKGAMVDRRGMYNNLMTKVPTLGLGPEDVIAQTAPQSFDISVWQFLTALLCGATVDILPDPVAHNPAALLMALSTRGITVLESVPAVMRGLLDDPGTPRELPTLRWLLPTGEAVPPELCHRWQARYPGVALLNAYGPAECADDVAYHRIDSYLPPEAERVPIGRPVANLRLYVLDPDAEPLPVGVPGEICIAGVGVGRGYMHRPDLTAAAFIPDPHGPAESRFYCTGDLGRWRADGVLEYLGRVDHQVKLRGHRVELGEVEAVLSRHPAVGAVAVQAWPDARGDLQLVAYIVPPGGALETPDDAALRDFLGARLPEYMLPTFYYRLAALPLNPNGKLDRGALPRPQGMDGTRVHVATGTPTEEVLAGIWSAVLGCGPVGREDHFFALGGHSLLATQVMARVNPAFGIALPFRSLFDFPRLGELAAQVDQLRAEAQHAPMVPPPEPRASQGEDLPLSYAQQRLWFMLQLDSDSSFYHFATAVRVTGPLDVPALEATVNRIIARHAVLRTVFTDQGGEPGQQVLPELHLRVAVEDLRTVAKEQREQQLKQRLIQAQQTPFDLHCGPLLRVAVWHLEAGEVPVQALLFCFHHIVFDGWSFGVFLREFTALYPALQAGRPVTLPEISIQYGDYVLWQRQQLRGAFLERLLHYWTGQLLDAPVCLNLPIDRPRTAGGSDAAGTHAFELGDLSDTLIGFSRQQGVSLFMTLLAALNVLLHALTGAMDLVIGADVANRPQRVLEPLIGFFINLVALRTRLDGNPSFLEILSRVRQVTLDASSHQDLPFNRLVDAVRPPRSTAYAPIFQVKLVCHNVPLIDVDVPELTVVPLTLPTEHTELDLVLHVYQAHANIRCVFEYRTALFDFATISRLTEIYTELLAQVSVAPERRLTELAAALRARYEALRRAAHAEQQALQVARLETTKRRRVTRP